MKRKQRWIIVSDIHAPYHDQEVLAKVTRCVHDLKPDGFIINGDCIDLSSLSHYDEGSLEKLRDKSLGKDYAAGLEIVERFELALPRSARRVFLYGNHEDRFPRELARLDRTKLSGAVLTPTDGLRLREFGYDVYEDWKQDSYRLGDHLEVTHGLYTPVHVAKKHLDEFQGSIIVGHSHRFQTFVAGKRGAWNFGFLGNMNHKGFHYATRTQRDKWVQSFGVVDIDDNGQHYVQPIQIHNKCFIYDGRVY